MPDSQIEQVKTKLFDAGAGRIGNYDSCSWQTKGIGQYRPLENSNPYEGDLNKIHSTEEWLLEVVCSNNRIDEVINALLLAHPYETPAYSFWETNQHDIKK